MQSATSQLSEGQGTTTTRQRQRRETTKWFQRAAGRVGMGAQLDTTAHAETRGGHSQLYQKSPDRSAYHVNWSPVQSVTILEKIIELVRKIALTVDMQNLAIQFKSVSPLGLMTY